MKSSKDNFSLSRLEYFEKSCLHYPSLLADGVNILRNFVNDNDLDICDVGCGTGVLSRLLLDKFHVQSLYAIDPDNELLNVCRSSIEPYSNGSFQCINSDGFSFLTSQKNKFDIIASSYVIHNLEQSDKIKLINSISDSLNMGGKFLLIDKIAKTQDIDLVCLNEQIGQFIEFYKPNSQFLREMKFWVTHYIEDELPKYRYTEQFLEETLSNASLNIVYNGNRKLLDTIVIAVKQ